MGTHSYPRAPHGNQMGSKPLWFLPSLTMDNLLCFGWWEFCSGRKKSFFPHVNWRLEIRPHLPCQWQGPKYPSRHPPPPRHPSRELDQIWRSRDLDEHRWTVVLSAMPGPAVPEHWALGFVFGLMSDVCGDGTVDPCLDIMCTVCAMRTRFSDPVEEISIFTPSDI